MVENSAFVRGGLFPRWKTVLLREGVFSSGGKRSFCAREAFPILENVAFAREAFPILENVAFARGSLFPYWKTLLLRELGFSRAGIRSFWVFPAMPLRVYS